ncbi:unnamed protein product, partial [Arabidopsis halleri]
HNLKVRRLNNIFFSILGVIDIKYLKLATFSHPIKL